MKKRAGIVLCLLGVAAIILSLLIPIATLSQMDGAIGIIGGADWPTFFFCLKPGSYGLRRVGALPVLLGLY